MYNNNRPRIGIALGSGSARGWSHIGILQQLNDMGIRPEIVCGCSIGSIVGAAYVAENLNKLEKWALSFSKLDMMRYFELKTSFNGVIHQQKLREVFHQHICAEQQSIEGLKTQFATVATDLHSGQEIWLREDKVVDAVWASIALPGLFPPVSYHHRWLVDGGLVNPVPVSLCKAMGADIVIAVNLNSNVLSAMKKKKNPETAADTKAADNDEQTSGESADNSLLSNVTGTLKEYSNSLFPNQKDENPPPGIVDAVAGSIYIMQDKITRSRMVGDPPEILLNPRVGDLGLLEFYRAEEAIQEGRDCVLRMKNEIERIMAYL
ncbi:MAG: patatin-like phospholipase family protein [Thiolinea sp.]